MKVKEIEELYERYKQDIYGYLLSLTRHPTLSEDLLQETFVRAISSIQKFEGRSSVKTWLFAIARNSWLEYRRKEKPMVEFDDLIEQYLYECTEDQLMTKEAIEKVKKLLQQKDERAQKIVMMRAEGYSFAEIAENMQLSENSARVIDFRTKKWVKAILEKEGF